jgi:hypothetical protein
MSDPQPKPDVEDKPGLPVYQPAITPPPEKTVPPPESSAEGEPDHIVKPGMSVGN